MIWYALLWHARSHPICYDILLLDASLSTRMTRSSPQLEVSPTSYGTPILALLCQGIAAPLPLRQCWANARVLKPQLLFPLTSYISDTDNASISISTLLHISAKSYRLGKHSLCARPHHPFLNFRHDVYLHYPHRVHPGRRCYIHHQCCLS